MASESTPDDPSIDARATPDAAERERRPPGDRIDLADAAAAERWCAHFGVTREQLEEAVKAAGTSADAVREHLLNQGASAGAG